MRLGPIQIVNARAFGAGVTYYTATGWIAVVAVAGEIRIVLGLSNSTDTTYQVTVGVQTATTDPEDADDWDYYKVGPTQLSTVGDKIMIRMESPVYSGKFWIRLGVAASISGGQAGDIESGDVSFMMAAAPIGS